MYDRYIASALLYTRGSQCLRVERNWNAKRARYSGQVNVNDPLLMSTTYMYQEIIVVIVNNHTSQRAHPERTTK